MPTSMKEIALCIDRLYPPDSLLTLAGRFRYEGVAPGGRPTGGKSLRTLAARVQGPQSKKLEFLHYNTYLIKDNLQLLDAFKIVANWGSFMLALNLFPARVLSEVLKKVGSDEVCDTLFPPIVEICGVSANPLNLACRSIGLAGDIGGWILEHVSGAIDWVMDLLAVPVEWIVWAVCELLGLVLPVEVHLKEADDIGQRSADIGVALRQYDLASLCEVWRSEHRDTLLSLVNHGPYFCGPPEPSPDRWQHMGSGLLVFSPTLQPIWQEDTTDHQYHEYVETGVHRPFGNCDFGMIVDADKWACKGVQLTLVNVGCGTLEVYSTHTYSGGDMPDDLCDAFGGKPDDAEKELVRKVQIKELADFILATHHDDRVAIIVGDFNVPPVERDGLRNQLCNIEGLEFDDWYALTMFSDDCYPEKYVNGHETKKDFGHTYRGGNWSNFDTHCPLLAPNDIVDDKGNITVAKGQRVGHLIDEGMPDYYCNETWQPANADAAGDRIDYIFVQRPVKSHAFNLDVSRIRRRTFKRSMYDKEEYLSDHLGLEVTLFASPK